MSPLVVRRFDDTEIPTLLAFYRANFGAGDRVARLFEWRAQGEDSGHNQPFGAWLDTVLLGTVNVVQWTMAGAGQAIATNWQQDSIVSEAARGKGVGKALVNGAGAGWAVVFAKGTSKAMYALRKAAGFVDAPNATYLLMVLRPFATGGGWRRQLGAPFLAIRNWFRRLPATPASMTIAPLESFGPFYDELARRQAAGTRVGLRKSAKYLRWRYLECPIRRYQIYQVIVDGTPRGAVVLRVPDGPKGDAWLVDVVADLDDRVTVMALVGAALEAARRSGASLLRTFATSPHARAVLFQAGFIDTSYTPHFTYRLQQPTWEAGPDRVEWNFWHGDGDAELYQ